MKRFCEVYISNAGLIGALYCIVPTLVWFTGVFLAVPFRGVYLLRLALCCTVGALIGANINRVGLKAWLDKHRFSKNGATVADGVIIGSLVGLGVSLLPPLTALIATRHLHQALLFIVAAWLTGILLGGVIGGLLASIGRQYIKPGEY